MSKMDERVDVEAASPGVGQDGHRRMNGSSAISSSNSLARPVAPARHSAPMTHDQAAPPSLLVLSPSPSPSPSSSVTLALLRPLLRLAESNSASTTSADRVDPSRPMTGASDATM